MPATARLLSDPARSASGRMVRFADRLDEGRVTIGEVVEALGDTGLGLALLLMMLPVFVSIPGVPTAFMVGLLVVLLGVQVLFGIPSLRLPRRVMAYGLSAAKVRRVLRQSVPWLVRAERWLRHDRLPSLTSPLMHRLLGLVLIAQGLTLLVPLPFGNYPPALAVVALGLGLMERDGLAIACGLVLAVLALLWNVLLAIVGAELLAWGAWQLGW